MSLLSRLRQNYRPRPKCGFLIVEHSDTPYRITADMIRAGSNQPKGFIHFDHVIAVGLGSIGQYHGFDTRRLRHF